MRAAHADERWTDISTTSIHVEMPLSRQRSDHIHELHVHDDGVAERTCRQRSSGGLLKEGSGALKRSREKGAFLTALPPPNTDVSIPLDSQGTQHEPSQLLRRTSSFANDSKICARFPLTHATTYKNPDRRSRHTRVLRRRPAARTCAA